MRLRVDEATLLCLRCIKRFLSAIAWIAFAILTWLWFRSEPLRIVDGDSLNIHLVRYRLWGIDAPERRDWCRKNDRDWDVHDASTEALKRIVRNKHVRCGFKYFDDYWRVVTNCYADDTNVGEELVRQGWACDDPEFSDGHFSTLEAEARSDKFGLWACGARPC